MEGNFSGFEIGPGVAPKVGKIPEDPVASDRTRLVRISIVARQVGSRTINLKDRENSARFVYIRLPRRQWIQRF